MGTRRAPPSAGRHTSSQPSSSPQSPRCSASCSCRDAPDGDSRQETAQRPALPNPSQRALNAMPTQYGKEGRGTARGFPGTGGLLQGPGQAWAHLGQLHPEPVAVAQLLARGAYAGAAPELDAVAGSAEGSGASTRGRARGSHTQPQALCLPYRQQHSRRARRILVKLVKHLARHESQRRRQRPPGAEVLRCLRQEAYSAQ